MDVGDFSEGGVLAKGFHARVMELVTTQTCPGAPEAAVPDQPGHAIAEMQSTGYFTPRSRDSSNGSGIGVGPNAVQTM